MSLYINYIVTIMRIKFKRFLNSDEFKNDLEGIGFNIIDLLISKGF